MLEPFSEPLVDIVMATKNSARFLSEALASISLQNSVAHRLIVVDGGSTDETVSMVKAYPGSLVLEQRSKGFLGAWNEGIQAGRAPWVAFLDSDDYWAPSKLAMQFEIVQRQPTVEYVYGRVNFFVESGAYPRGFRPEVLGRSHLIPTTGTALVRRRVIDRIGLFDTRCEITGDIAWFANLREKSEVATVDEVLLHKRIHTSNLGQITGSEKFRRELLQLIRHRISERRVSGCK